VVAGGIALVAAVVLRFWTTSDLWLDEALSVNISRLPLDQISDALRQDGHPPLYYLLLHGWIEVFGVGDFAVRALSGIFAVAAFPLAWFAGQRLGGRAMAITSVLVLAASPFAIRYATEARMYSMVIFLVLAGYLALRRALERPSAGRLVLVALIAAALALSQYWNLFLLGVVVVGLAYRAWKAPEAGQRGAARRVLAATLVGCATFAVWLPAFITQVQHTGTPWGDPQFPWVALARGLMAFSGDPEDGESFVTLFVLLALALLAVFGRAVDARRTEIDVRTQSLVRWEGAAALGAFLLGATLSSVGGTTFEPRYGASVVALFVLLVAVGTAAFGSRTVRVGAVVLVVALGLIGGLRAATTQRTQAADVADVIAAEAEPGDVVVYCPDQLGPAVSRVLADTPGLVQMTFPDGARPERVDWTDYLDRIEAADPTELADAAVQAAGEHTVWFVNVGLLRTARQCTALGDALAEARPAVTRVIADPTVLELIGLSQHRANP
jgi:mannosyltransferase